MPGRRELRLGFHPGKEGIPRYQSSHAPRYRKPRGAASLRTAGLTRTLWQKIMPKTAGAVNGVGAHEEAISPRNTPRRGVAHKQRMIERWLNMERSADRRRIMPACLCVLTAATAMTQAKERIHTGSQASYVHRIQLFDEKVQLITPESTVPFSPRATCNKCHSYHRISKGWHFHAGLAEPDPNLGGTPNGEPFFVTEPISGTQIPVSFRRWARESGMTPDALGIKRFDFALTHGSHMPGGGMLEFTVDKDGEAKRLSEEMWAKTGTLEIDCLMCHLSSGYNPEMRADQIDYRNFKWAPTAAAGFGMIRGEVGEEGEEEEDDDADPFEAEEEEEGEAKVNVKVEYVAGKFDKGNFVTLNLTRHIPNSNCMFCHYNRLRDGTDLSAHQRTRDIHFDAGMLCTDCHKNGLGHRISRNDGTPADIACDPDNATLSCQGCHESGRAGAPKPDHPGLPGFHLKKMTCVACHSGFVPGETVVAQQTAIAHKLGLSTEHDLTKRPPSIYGPVFRRDPIRGKINLFRYAYPRWYGKMTDKGIKPLPIGSVKSAIEEIEDAVKDDDEDEKPEIDTDAEIAAMLKALAGVIEEEKGAKVVLVARGGIHAVDELGKLTWSPNVAGEPHYWSQGHPVRPARESLGSGGCTDCHDKHESFYMAKLLVDDKTEPTPSLRSHDLLGTTECLVELGGLREVCIKPILIWLIPIVAGLCLLHYVTFGPRPVAKDDPDDLVKLFGPIERLMHMFLFLAFLALAATALGFLLAKLPHARGGFWTSHAAVELHEVAGVVFACAIAVVTLRWFISAIPARYDIEWVRMLGGYLWIKGHPPAGKFNFGQKMFFWGAMALGIILSITGIAMWIKPGGDGGLVTVAYTVHDLAAILLIALATTHLYLCTIANPGTIKSIFTGKVTKAWAHTHHPNWAKAQEAKQAD